MNLSVGDILIIVSVIVVIALGVFVYVGKKNYTKNLEAQAFINQHKMVTPIFHIIHWKNLLKTAKLPITEISETHSFHLTLAMQTTDPGLHISQTSLYSRQGTLKGKSKNIKTLKQNWQAMKSPF